MNLSLTGKNAVVGGASRGIGRAIAIELAKNGANVVALSRDSGLLNELLESLDKSAGQNHEVHSIDLADSEALKRLTADIGSRMQVHIIINNSGGPEPGPASSALPEHFLAAIQGHLAAYQIMLTGFLPGMRRAGYGRIINILSTSVVQPLKGLGVSNSLRAAVANWARTLASELAADGITVNNILPGMTSTDRLASLFKHKAEATRVNVAEIEQINLLAIPAKRFGRPEEIAWTAAFLASEAAAYINGVSIPVDGGRLACQ